MSKGKIKQIIGSVLDIEFESGHLPEILTHLKFSPLPEERRKKS